MASAGLAGDNAGDRQAHCSTHGVEALQDLGDAPTRDGLQVSALTVMRALKDVNLLQFAAYQSQGWQLAATRKAAFLVPQTRPNQV